MKGTVYPNLTSVDRLLVPGPGLSVPVPSECIDDVLQSSDQFSEIQPIDDEFQCFSELSYGCFHKRFRDSRLKEIL